MRFQDWDCLLFPQSNDNTAGQIPLQEFRTTCHAIQEGFETDVIILKGGHVRAANISPLVTCFVPSQPHSSRFSVSLHCWTESQRHFASLGAGQTFQQKMWRIQVKLDGTCVVDDFLAADTLWPQTICMSAIVSRNKTRLIPNQDSSNLHDESGSSYHLAFPSFDRTVADARTFSPAEELGRIKIELCAGYLEDHKSTTAYRTIEKVVTFAFVHAPLGIPRWKAYWQLFIDHVTEHLERCGIAWPNLAMFNNPICVPAADAQFASTATPTQRCTIASSPSQQYVSPGGKMPDAPPSTPTFGGFRQNTAQSSEAGSCYDSIRSRQSSSSSIYKLQPAAVMYKTAPTSPEEAESHAILADTAAEHTNLTQRKDSKCMPPPAFPASAFSIQAKPPRLGLVASVARNATTIDKYGTEAKCYQRAESQGSDISMHTNCQHFPACTIEDEHGRVLHHSPVPPLTAIRVKRENMFSADKD